MFDDENEALPGPEVTAAEDNTEGSVIVSTRRGYVFVPSTPDIDRIDHVGVSVTAEQAEALIAESNGLVSIINENKE